MPTLTFCSTKGGAGKSTGSVLLACELAVRGATVSLIDADPNQPVARWGKKPGKPKTLNVIGGVTEENLIDVIEDAARKTAFVIVDLEGSASLMVAQSMSRADLVVIPCKGSTLDVAEAIKVFAFVKRQEKAYGRKIPYKLLWSQTNPAIRSRGLKALEAEMVEQGVPVFSTALHERDAYRAVFAFGGTLHDLDRKQVPNIDAAAQNVRELTAEIVASLQPSKSQEKVA